MNPKIDCVASTKGYLMYMITYRRMLYSNNLVFGRTAGVNHLLLTLDKLPY